MRLIENSYIPSIFIENGIDCYLFIACGHLGECERWRTTQLDRMPMHSARGHTMRPDTWVWTGSSAHAIRGSVDFHVNEENVDFVSRSHCSIKTSGLGFLFLFFTSLSPSYNVSAFLERFSRRELRYKFHKMSVNKSSLRRFTLRG